MGERFVVVDASELPDHSPNDPDCRVLVDRAQTDDLVFPSRAGKHLTNGSIWRPMRLAQDRAKLPRISFHDLRHSYASQLATAGTPIAAIQRYLGHADIQTTMRYAHLCPSALEGYVDALDAIAPSFGEARERTA